MIEKFEVGKYYRWIGPNPEDPDEYLPNWNNEGGMNYVLDGKKLKCIKVYGKIDYSYGTIDYNHCALFDGMKPFDGREGNWDWGSNLNNFEEVKVIDNQGNYLLEF